jgi:Flp pilus assembly secretin CpaC
MERGALLAAMAISLISFPSLADDNQAERLEKLAAKQAELDRLAQEVAELEQQLDRPTQATVRFQMLSVSLAEWESLNPPDDAAEESKAVSREWLARLARLNQQEQVQSLVNSTLVTANGRAARFISGGEFPVPVPAPGTQKPGTMTVDWLKFGKIVEALPLIKGDGRIDLELTAEHSLLDTNTEVKINDIKVPGILRTRFQSRVEARFGETIFVARGKFDDRMIVLLVTPERVK